MGMLKELVRQLQTRFADTPDTPEKNVGYHGKPSIHAGCTPDTPDTSCFVDTRINAQFAQFGEAVNDPASTQPPDLVQPSAPAPDKTDKPPKQTFMENADTWRELDRAYQAHHFKCPICKAAGLGYGLRCGAGAALWTAYSDAT